MVKHPAITQEAMAFFLSHLVPEQIWLWLLPLTMAATGPVVSLLAGRLYSSFNQGKGGL